jgi:glucan phosphoethanolaminetransferase (alkaline phosphatase superfamily)
MIEMIATKRGTEVTTKLTFDDTILIETGEMGDLQCLADYISLKCADLITPKKMSLLITCGLVFAYITVIYSLILDPAIFRQRVLLVSFSNAAIVILITALSVTKTKQPELIGSRIGFLGLVLAAVPYLAGFVAR